MGGGFSPFFYLGDWEMSGPSQGDNEVPLMSGITDSESRDGSVVDLHVSVVPWGNGSPDGLALLYGVVEWWSMESS